MKPNAKKSSKTKKPAPKKRASPSSKPPVPVEAPRERAAIGRPTKYTKEHCDPLVYGYALLGKTDEEIAVLFGIHVATLYDWFNEHPTFHEARARGKEPADSEVVVSLHKSAKGFTRTVTKTDAEGNEREVETYFPPDTQAARWWLQNRQGKKFKDKAHVAVGGDPEAPPVATTDISPEDAARAYREMLEGKKDE